MHRPRTAGLIDLRDARSGAGLVIEQQLVAGRSGRAFNRLDDIGDARGIRLDGLRLRLVRDDINRELGDIWLDVRGVDHVGHDEVIFHDLRFLLDGGMSVERVDAKCARPRVVGAGRQQGDDNHGESWRSPGTCTHSLLLHRRVA